MNIRLVLFSLLLTVFGQHKSYSQDTLSMDQTLVWAHDTAVFNENLSITVTVINTGSNVYTDSMTLYGVLINNNPVDTVVSVNHMPVAAMNPLDTTMLTLNWLTDPLKYVGGGNNITVIWPANPNNDNYVGDSLRLSTYIDTTLGISMWLPTEFKIYPNPTAGNIRLEFDEKTNIENVRIYSLRGRLIKRFGGENNYDLSLLPAGSYMIQVEDIHGRLSKGKLIIRQ